MIRLNLREKDTEPLEVLCLGCHSDDIEIGCGGTLLRLTAEHPGSVVHWVVFSTAGVRKTEAQRSAKLFNRHSGLMDPMLHSFPDGFMPFVGTEIKKVFEDLKKVVSPDVIFTQSRMDAHQDHRLIADLTWNTFRDHLILEYEIPKYDGDLGRPNVYAPLELEVRDEKINNLMEVFRSQSGKPWFQKETFLGLMRLRGMECNSPSGYAEAFYVRKIVL